ncbi:galactokinase [Histoplasma capsulatum G186AR]|uniref:Galactokinase n=2 Tax=Ajellomyces capsulatus TaxID=5037 RepID=C0NU20_AJECG|nr:galactokinase [Histoplasma capsulatum G186AR]EEH04900.1 galactokinase [Histoplasma capsulatum G186AR]KAG5287555.1 galactokinase [Histoplasma capsulatum]QSS70631.1 galactokinase [Histoplasma capsulatum G186AR]
MNSPGELVPQTESIADVYSTDPAGGVSISSDQKLRWTNFIATFKKLYGASPDFVARSPGRVNIIGEHIDYSLYDVLPTAVSVDVLIAVKVHPAEKTQESWAKVANTNGAKFASGQFTIPKDKDVEIDSAKHEWINYFKAGLRVALKLLREKNQVGDFTPVSFEVLVDGNVPPGGGISSSAAFVCSSALAGVKANGYDISKQELQDIAIVSERAVGVYSGGMDQAASIFSLRGYLLYVRFFPSFHFEHIPVPKAHPEITFLMAQSFVTSNKAETAPRHYNLRVAECTLATVVLAKMHNLFLPKDCSSLGYSLRNFHEELMRKEGRLQDPLEYQLDSIIMVAADTLTKEEGYTREDVAALLGISISDLEKQFLSTFPVQAERFLLRQRALHCFKEARRVLDFKSCLSRSQKQGHLDEHNVKYLGQLLNESMASCRDLYDCTCPEVDDICEIALRAGALGSRVTGAGWGGCTVHMVPQEKVADVTEALKKEYYYKKFPDISQEKLEEAIVISKPSNGTFLISGAAISESA